MENRDDDDELLEQWCAKLQTALEMENLGVDIESVLGLAGRAAHSVLRPAAPLTTFVVGYAAGRAAALGDAAPEAAVSSATNVALGLCREEQRASDSTGTDSTGSNSTDTTNG